MGHLPQQKASFRLKLYQTSTSFLIFLLFSCLEQNFSFSMFFLFAIWIQKKGKKNNKTVTNIGFITKKQGAQKGAKKHEVLKKNLRIFNDLEGEEKK